MVFLVGIEEVDVGVVECVEVNRVQMVGLVDVECFVITIGESGSHLVWVGSDIKGVFFGLMFVIFKYICRFSDNVGFSDIIGFHVVFLVGTGEVDIGIVWCFEVNRDQMVGLVEVERFVIPVEEGRGPLMWVGSDVGY